MFFPREEGVVGISWSWGVHLQDEGCVGCVCNSSMCTTERKDMVWGVGRESYCLKCHPLGSMEPLEVFKLEVA